MIAPRRPSTARGGRALVALLVVTAALVPLTASAGAAPPTVPGAPTAVTAIGGDGFVSIAWTAPADDGGSAVIDYIISWDNGASTFDVTTAQTSAVVNATNGTTYVYRVRAVNAVGEGPDSDPSDPEMAIGRPPAPTDVVAEAGNASATVSWMAPASDGGSPLTQYKVESILNGVATGEFVTVDPAEVSVSFPGLLNGEMYMFKARAVNAYGESFESWASNAVTPGAPPGAPTNVVAVPGEGSATVSFDPPADPGTAPINNYTVNGWVDGVVDAGHWATGSASPLTVQGLDPHLEYTFTVKADNGFGVGAESTPSNAVTPLEGSGGGGFWIPPFWAYWNHIRTASDGYQYSLPSPMPRGEKLVAGTLATDIDEVWAVNAKGRVYNSPTAPHYGDLRNLRLKAPIVGFVAAADRAGYYLVASDGGVFAFGSARFRGSLARLQLNAPIVGMALSCTGDGYYLVGADGGVFTFGDATYKGSLARTRLKGKIFGIVPSCDGTGGYWLAGRDGGVFAFGSAPYYGSLATQHANVYGFVPEKNEHGYYLLRRNGTFTGLGPAV